MTFATATRDLAGRVTPVLELADGTTARRVDDSLEIRDRAGTLLVRFADGAAEIRAATGDLKLSAPTGRVVLQAGVDVVVEAERDIRQRAGRRLSLGTMLIDEAGGAPELTLGSSRAELRAEHVEVESRTAKVLVGRAQILARIIETTAEAWSADVERLELKAVRFVTKARDSVREISDLCESYAGRVRTIVKGPLVQHAQTTNVTSDGETVVNGERVLLG